MTVCINTYQLHLHFDNKKLTETWHQTLVDCRTYAIQKKKMNDRSTKNLAPDQKKDRWTLKRKKTTPITPLSSTKETVVDNPLFGVTVPNRRASQLIDDEYMKKSPSMNAMVDPTKKTRYQMTTTESDSGQEVRAQKRKGFSRSTSVDSLHKIAQSKFILFLLMLSKYIFLTFYSL